MKFFLFKEYKLYKNLNIFFNLQYNIFFVKTFLGIFIFKLPSYFFFKNIKNKISFIFNIKLHFSSFISHFFYNYKNANNLYIVRLKIRGLGFQFYKISKNLFSLHFHFINFFYLFLPFNILNYWYKKRVILVSNNLFILKTVFKCILCLKKLGPYRLLGIRYPRQIIILKKGGKSKLK